MHYGILFINFLRDLDKRFRKSQFLKLLQNCRRPDDLSSVFLLCLFAHFSENADEFECGELDGDFGRFGDFQVFFGAEAGGDFFHHFFDVVDGEEGERRLF